MARYYVVSEGSVSLPPMVLDPVEARRQFYDYNGVVADAAQANAERRLRHAWTNEEKRIFIKKYLVYPKQFHKIATFLENRSTADVVEFYFTHKLTFNLKRLLTEQQLKRRQRRIASGGGIGGGQGSGAADEDAGGELQKHTVTMGSNRIHQMRPATAPSAASSLLLSSQFATPHK